MHLIADVTAGSVVPRKETPVLSKTQTLPSAVEAQYLTIAKEAVKRREYRRALDCYTQVHTLCLTIIVLGKKRDSDLFLKVSNPRLLQLLRVDATSKGALLGTVELWRTARVPKEALHAARKLIKTSPNEARLHQLLADCLR
jgi:hypothetical protein